MVDGFLKTSFVALHRLAAVATWRGGYLNTLFVSRSSCGQFESFSARPSQQLIGLFIAYKYFLLRIPSKWPMQFSGDIR
jgi:hypothetical protein